MEAIRGLVLWERNNDGPLDYLAPNHHTLSVYLGGGVRTWSCETKTWGFPDALCLLPEGYDSHWKHDGYVKALHLYFTTEDLEALNWTPTSEPAPLIYAEHPLMRHFATALADQLDWTDPADRLAVDHLTLAMLSQMSKVAPTSARALPRATVERLEARMHALEDGVPTLRELADLAGLSPRHLTRGYKEATGRTLMARQRDIQIELAKDLLRGTEPLSAIALACGFGSQSHFTHAFGRATGTTPDRWRKAQRG